MATKKTTWDDLPADLVKRIMEFRARFCRGLQNMMRMRARREESWVQIPLVPYAQLGGAQRYPGEHYFRGERFGPGY